MDKLSELEGEGLLDGDKEIERLSLAEIEDEKELEGDRDIDFEIDADRDFDIEADSEADKDEEIDFDKLGDKLLEIEKLIEGDSEELGVWDWEADKLALSDPAVGEAEPETDEDGELERLFDSLAEIELDRDFDIEGDSEALKLAEKLDEIEELADGLAEIDKLSEADKLFDSLGEIEKTWRSGN